MDRMEWLAEKATEIGFDELALLDCDNSERRAVKTERLDKIIVSAMKQSRKACKPLLRPMEKFADFVKQPFDGTAGPGAYGAAEHPAQRPGGAPARREVPPG